MARKKATVDSTIAEIKENIKKGTLVFGREITLKNLRTGNLSKIYLSSNAPDELRNDISYYSTMVELDVVELDVPNDELGVVCKKPFSISVLGLIKG